eukprot:6311617-Pyramimonas_sp.AAC.1
MSYSMTTMPTRTTLMISQLKGDMNTPDATRRSRRPPYARACCVGHAHLKQEIASFPTDGSFRLSRLVWLGRLSRRVTP